MLSSYSTPKLLFFKIFFNLDEQLYKLRKHNFSNSWSSKKIFSGEKLVWIILFWCKSSKRFISFNPISIVSNSVNRVLFELFLSEILFSFKYDKGVLLELGP